MNMTVNIKSITHIDNGINLRKKNIARQIKGAHVRKNDIVIETGDQANAAEAFAKLDAMDLHKKEVLGSGSAGLPAMDTKVIFSNPDSTTMEYQRQVAILLAHIPVNNNAVDYEKKKDSFEVTVKGGLSKVQKVIELMGSKESCERTLQQSQNTQSYAHCIL